MIKFITGLLVQNKAGATYDDIIYDRKLKLHLPNGQELSIFDPAEPISTELATDEAYEMVLIPFVVSVNIVAPSQISAESDSTLDSKQWQGTIIDLHWKAAKDRYRYAHPELYEQEWILLTTSYGNVLLSPQSTQETLHTGMMVQWANTRLDLYAIV